MQKTPREGPMFPTATARTILLVLAAAVGAADQPISGRRLLLTESGAAAVPGISARSADHAIVLGDGNGSVDDPTAFGASLRVRGNASFDSSYDLPRTGWRLIGRPGQNKGYEFH